MEECTNFFSSKKFTSKNGNLVAFLQYGSHQLFTSNLYRHTVFDWFPIFFESEHSIKWLIIFLNCHAVEVEYIAGNTPPLFA